MKFFDIDRIQQNSGISNKYLLTTVVAARARALSEDKRSRGTAESGKAEKVISMALSELEYNDLTITVDGQVPNERITPVEHDESDDEPESAS